MIPQDLRDLQAAGWDIASHSVTHSSIWLVAAAETELHNSKSTLTELGLMIDSFVWPEGDYNKARSARASAEPPDAPFTGPRGAPNLMITHKGLSLTR